MKRKLISYEAFGNIQSNSLSAAEKELLEASQIFAKALDVENLNLVCYGPEDALYESGNGTYVHTNYQLNESAINFDNIEQLVIDETTENDHSKNTLASMLDALLDGQEEKANSLFDSYVSAPRFKRSLHESVQVKTKTKKAVTAKKKSPARMKTALKFKSKGDKAKKLREWKTLVENVTKFVRCEEYGHFLTENTVNFDEKGNVAAVVVPTAAARNEAKMLEFNWKTLDSDVKVLRSGAKQLSENVEFCKSVAVLKRQNALNDDEKLQEALENIISRWPSVLYLTQSELATVVGESLTAIAATNYDDQTCDFMAEAILRTAHETYVDRVSKINNLAGVKVEETESEDAYETFKNVVDAFYPSLDENAALEIQAYIDLYDALRGAYNASESETLKSETATHLQELAAIIEQEVEPTLEIITAAAEWLTHLVETNLETAGWSHPKPHVSVVGDHPAMSQKAKQPYSPASDGSGDWGDPAPASDGKNYKGGEADTMRGNAWGNEGGGDVYPSLQNPYVPNSFGDYKIKGEKHIDGDSQQLGHSDGSDTWPALQNPYVPSSETPYTYKMNQGKDADLVVDK